MVSVVGLVGLAVLVGVHTLVAAVATRLLRVRLSSAWGPLVYVTTLVPLLLVLSTMLLSGVFGLGPDLGGVRAVLFVLVALPTVLGATIDYVWMPAPDDVALPETT